MLNRLRARCRRLHRAIRGVIHRPVLEPVELYPDVIASPRSIEPQPVPVVSTKKLKVSTPWRLE